MSARLERCPECGASWPKSPDYALRGCGWLQGLSRSVSPTNSDVRIHDGAHGRNRFLQFEVKSPREQWPPKKGELWMLGALAEQSNWTVRILRGTTRDLKVHAVADMQLDMDGIRTHVEAVRRAVDRWLNGALWREAERLLTPPESIPVDLTHVHGWARVEGVWTCIQDHYAVGHRPDTGCGETLPQFP